MSVYPQIDARHNECVKCVLMFYIAKSTEKTEALYKMQSVKVMGNGGSVLLFLLYFICY